MEIVIGYGKKKWRENVSRLIRRGRNNVYMKYLHRNRDLSIMEIEF